MTSELQNPNDDPKYWKKCSTCKKELSFSSKYYLCSVSTCRHKRKGFRFCSVGCWDAHLGFANHREAWAEEAMSPSKEQFLALESGKQLNAVRSPIRKLVGDMPAAAGGGAASPSTANLNLDTLVVVSKVKKLIKDQSSFSTSQCGIEALTQKVAQECLKGIEQAKAAGRKTVMGRDIK